MEEKITDIKLNRKGENNCEYVKELTLQFFSNSKNFLDIPCHYLLDFVEFIIQFSDVPLTVDVWIQFLGLLYECIYQTKVRGNSEKIGHKSKKNTYEV